LSGPRPQRNRPPAGLGFEVSGFDPNRTELSLVRFENVGLRYGLGPEVLRDLSFQIPAHSFQFLTGPSGAGKTSLLRLLFLSMRPTRGLVNLFGHDV
jgi:cell division transport system ATP-binding protein